ncbi:MAG: ribonuclease E/G [Pseudomonadota bacterium]
MKGRLLLISGAKGVEAAALTVNGMLEDLIIAAPGGAPETGETWGAKVIRKSGKAAGAFLDLGQGHHGFLRDAKAVREGAIVTVQIASQPEAGKALPVTQRLLFKNRLMIHTPGAPGINVSRQIRDAEERAALTDAVETACRPYTDAWRAAGEALSPAPPDETAAARRHRAMVVFGHLIATGGFIIRSAAEGAPEAEIARALEDTLTQRLATMPGDGEGEGDGRIAPYLRLRPWQTALRDWADPIPEAVIAHERDAAEIEAAAGSGAVDGAILGRLERGRADPFETHGIWDHIARLSSPTVALPGGGSMVIEATTALVAVDVNTGGDFAVDAGIRANVEAVRALPRQLRLRGLGGQIVVDFAPMAKKDRLRLEDALKAALKRDPIETVSHGWTTMGLYELQRKRERRALVLPSFLR